MEMLGVDNPRYGHHVRIVRVCVGHSADAPYGGSDDVETVLYDGCGRSFTDTTTEGSQAVWENKRKASVPVRYDGWPEGGEPTAGDLIRVTRCKNVEEGVVYDCESDNNRTLVYWTLRRV